MLLLSPTFLSAVLALFATTYTIRCLLSALRRVPGPWYSLFTGLVLKWHALHGNRTRYIHSLHLRHGPVVRIAPGEVAFASFDAVKEIYCSGGSGYDKTEFYDLFKIYGRSWRLNRTMFTTLNKEDHARRKRILADRYANSNVMRQPSISGIQKRSQNFVQLCRDSFGGSIDLFVCEAVSSPLLHSYAFDCVTHHLFHPFGASSLERKEDEDIMREVAFDDSLQNRLVQFYSPILHKLLGKALYFLKAKPRETPLADQFVLSTSAKSETAPFTLLSRLHDKMRKGSAGPGGEDGPDLEHLDVAAECLDHMAAGIDTTGDGLCFLMYQLSLPSSEGVQRRLREELRSSGAADLPFDRLHYLDAVVQEGLRCFPPIPMSLPRYVPRDGAGGCGGRVIDGYFVPGGTVVSCQAYSVHRINADVFPEPDRFKPDRWLEAEGDAARRRHMFAFANGGRGCVGKHLATAEMKLLLRNVYSRFMTVPDPTMTDQMMEMADQLISSRPAGQKCLLRFIPIDEALADS